MTSKGLLVVSPHGHEFLFVPEEGAQAAPYTLSVLQRSNGQWVRLQPQSAHRLRESMLGALLEFFGNLCRILNQTPNTTAHTHNITPKKTTGSVTRIRTTGRLHEDGAIKVPTR